MGLVGSANAREGYKVVEKRLLFSFLLFSLVTLLLDILVSVGIALHNGSSKCFDGIAPLYRVQLDRH